MKDDTERVNAIADRILADKCVHCGGGGWDGGENCGHCNPDADEGAVYELAIEGPSDEDCLTVGRAVSETGHLDHVNERGHLLSDEAEEKMLVEVGRAAIVATLTLLALEESREERVRRVVAEPEFAAGVEAARAAFAAGHSDPVSADEFAAMMGGDEDRPLCPWCNNPLVYHDVVGMGRTGFCERDRYMFPPPLATSRPPTASRPRVYPRRREQ